MVTSRMNIAQKLATFVFSPPCSAKDFPDRSKDSTNNLDNHRCQFTFSDGRQCRNQQAQLCVHHASKKQSECGAEGAPDAGLEGLCGDLTTATNINRALAQ